MNQKGFTPIIIILGIVLILGIVGGVYYFGKNFVKVPVSKPQVLVSSTPQPTQINETASWKTYTNNQYGYSIKYPSEANMSIDTYGGGYMTGGNMHRFNFIFPEELVGQNNRNNFVIEIEDNRLNLNTKEVIDNYVERIKNYKDVVGGTKIIIESLNKSLRPYTNNEINGLIGSYGWWTFHPVLVEAKNGKIYTFYMPESGRYPNDDTLKLFDQILSTFKFLPTSLMSEESGIKGKVVLSSTCSLAEQWKTECHAKPVQSTVLVKTDDGIKELSRFTSDIQGNFTVALSPGSYLLEPVLKDNLPFGRPQTITVEKGKFTQVTISYDTGLR